MSAERTERTGRTGRTDDSADSAVRTCCLVCPSWPEDDATGFERVVRAVENITPRLAVERPGLLFFPTRGPSRYFGGDVALAVTLIEVVTSAEVLDARVGIADGVLGARLAAISASPHPVVIDEGGSAAFLAGWPLHTLVRLAHADTEMVGLLERLGLHTLGAVGALDCRSLATRFGPEGRRLQRLCQGFDVAPMELSVPTAELVEELAFEPAVEQAEAMVFAARGLAERLFDRLRARGQACVGASMTLEDDEGTSLCASWRWEQDFTPRVLAELVRRRLEPGDHELPTRPVAVVRLRAEELAPLSGRQGDLWGVDYADLARVERLAASLQGLLGFSSVLLGEVGPGRTPLERTRWIPWGEPRGHDGTGPRVRRPPRPGETPSLPGGIPPPSPARVFDPPLPADLLDAGGRPIAVSARGEPTGAPGHLRCRALPGDGGSITAWEGPWLHDLRWWQPSSRRRRAWWRVIVGDETHGIACLVAIEHGRAGVEAIHD
ncbi:MAG: DNA polymerase Y family protein [Actinobacteria bacterium]|nr:DNA polymerase Y family protein [Actinomycetota bacterium]